MPMLLIALLQIAGPMGGSAETEAILRMRDAQRAETQRQTGEDVGAEASPVLRLQDDRVTLSANVPRAHAGHLATCLAKANNRAQDGIDDAETWELSGGGAYAALCRGYALGQAEHWSQAASAYEAGTVMTGLSPEVRAQLWSQGGNAALIAGDAARALRDLDSALDQPLPETLATGEIHLDRARARVATGHPEGARADLDRAVALAPSDPLAWLLSATLARRMDDLSLASTHIAQAARVAPDDAAVALEQGVILALSGGQARSARAAFQRARELGAGSQIGIDAETYLAQLDPDTDSSLNR